MNDVENPEMRNLEDHYPRRDDQVAAWIKHRRDEHSKPEDGTRHLIGAAWEALDALLDEYRLAADTGQSLENIVNGEESEPAEVHLMKKKKKKEIWGDPYAGGKDGEPCI